MRNFLQKSGNRSLLGGLMTAGIVAAALGIMACIDFPVPVGNPEAARIDDRLTGIWLGYTKKEDRDPSLIWVFRPWDKRTWMLQTVDLRLPHKDEPANEKKAGIAGLNEPKDQSAEEQPRWMRAEATNPQTFKVWKTKLGGEMFLTLEPMQAMDSKTGLSGTKWLIVRLTRNEKAGEITIIFVVNDFDELEKVAEALEEGKITKAQAQRQIERVIARNARNPELYFDDGGKAVFRRIPQAQYDRAAKVVGLPTEPFN